jgi:ankyrin repeat protein
MTQERQIRVRNARLWLERTPPIDTEDRVYQLLGLSWAASSPDMIAKFRDRLLAEQRTDGGWGQIPGRPSDAYATGEALSALNRAAGVLPSHSSWQRGLRYLLQTQKPDGTWFVSSRLNPPAPLSPPYFDSGFPYGHDQFISAMGTSWAASALLLALPESDTTPEPLDVSTFKPAAAPAWAETVLFGRIAELRKLIATGWDVNSATPRGTTALMMAAPEADKVSLLLQHGANLNARSKTRYTALMIAVSHHATDSVRLLLAHEADVTSPTSQPVQYGSTPVFLAALSGDEAILQALQERGAVTQSTTLAGGFFPVTPMSVAVAQRDLAMVKALIRTGVPVDDIASPNDGLTALDFSVFENDTKMAALLLAAGADVNHVDRLGYTPLLWAANVDFGDSAMLGLLLRAGANRQFKQRDNLTALELAARYKYTRHQKVLTEN